MIKNVLLFVVGTSLAAEASAQQKPLDFAHQIAPILKRHCVECHGGDNAKGGFSLNTRELFLENDMAAPGKPGESHFLELVGSADPDAQMPPKGKPRLPVEQITLLKAWIKAGMKWDAGITFATKKYEPPLHPRRPALPPVVKGRANSVDRIIDAYFAQNLQLRPAAISDAAFLRRVHLDLVGLLPTPQELSDFLSDRAPNKRTKMIDTLLADEIRYTEHWLTFWNDLLRNDYGGTGFITGGRKQVSGWLYESLIDNTPYDQMARELLTVQGSTTAEGPGAFYKILKKPDEMSRAVSQLLLGVRIECAQCHHHPSERWSQEDYTALAGFFTGVKLKKLPNGTEAVVSLGGKDLPHPRTSELVAPRALGASDADLDGLIDRRVAFANWLTQPDNEFFAKAIANRIWAHYLGRGLVEPVDDIRETNPATNEPLMNALSRHMIDVEFDMQAFTRTLLKSRVYQLSSKSNDSNRDDQQNFSHAAYKAIPAEALLDAISQTTGVAEKFNGWPEGYRAIQIWDNRMPSYFFRIFGRPVRATVCECERSGEPSISQALHLLNSPEIMAKIQHRDGTARRLANSELTDDELIDELYLTTLSRFPNEEERNLMREAFSDSGSERNEAVEDVLWALLNTKEFIFNH